MEFSNVKTVSPEKSGSLKLATALVAHFLFVQSKYVCARMLINFFGKLGNCCGVLNISAEGTRRFPSPDDVIPDLSM
jgi:hypothetical protein